MTAAKTTELPRRSKLAGLEHEPLGYRVETREGTIGRVEHLTYDKRWMIVRTGTRLFGTRHVVLADAVQSVVPARKQVFVELSEREIKSAPVYDSDTGVDGDLERRAEAYYGLIVLNRKSRAELVS